jgi:hypothetical protein
MRDVGLARVLIIVVQKLTEEFWYFLQGHDRMNLDAEVFYHNFQELDNLLCAIDTGK